MATVEAHLPENEPARLAGLHALAVLDTDPESRFDELAALAARICGTPMAQVNFIDADRQWTKASIGLAGETCSRRDSFCAHAILEPDLLVVEDARADARFAGNRFVHDDPHIRFYAGAPLVTPEGHAVGALCVIDGEPRRLRPEQAAALRTLAGQVVTELELRRMLAEERRLVAELVELDRLRTDFVSVVSHEFRNPLTAVLGFAQTLLRNPRNPPTADQQVALAAVEHNANRLLGLVEELLTGTQAASGSLTFAFEDADLAQVAREALARARLGADEKRIALEAAVPDTLPLRGDARRLAQALDNLLGNAVKYTPAGGTVAVEVTATGTSALVRVRDSGIGIPQEELCRLFTRFFRASSATSARIPGTGLGLVVVKAVAEGHEGSVAARSEPGAGTEFTLELPLDGPRAR